MAESLSAGRPALVCSTEQCYIYCMIYTKAIKGMVSVNSQVIGVDPFSLLSLLSLSCCVTCFKGPVNSSTNAKPDELMLTKVMLNKKKKNYQ